jgi:hypothetical protein
MKTCEGSGIQLHSFLNSALYGGEWSASRTGRFPPPRGEEVPGTPWIGSWVGPRDGPETTAKRKNPFPCRESNPERPVRSLITLLTELYGSHVISYKVWIFRIFWKQKFPGASVMLFIVPKILWVLSTTDAFLFIIFCPSPLLRAGIVTGYRLDELGSGVRFPAGTWNFFLHHRVQTSSGAHPASYPMGTGRSFPGGKAAGWDANLTTHIRLVPRSRMHGATTPLPIRLHGVVLS